MGYSPFSDIAICIVSILENVSSSGCSMGGCCIVVQGNPGWMLGKLREKWLKSWSLFNGNSRILNWRYLPFIRPIFQAYVSESPSKIWPEQWYGTNVPPYQRILEISHWFIAQNWDLFTDGKHIIDGKQITPLFRRETHLLFTMSHLSPIDLLLSRGMICCQKWISCVSAMAWRVDSRDAWHPPLLDESG